MKQDVCQGFLLMSILVLIALISVPLSVTASDKKFATIQSPDPIG